MNRANSLDSIEALAKNLNESSDFEKENNQLLVNGMPKKFPSGNDCDSPTFDKSEQIQFEKIKPKVFKNP